MGFTVRNNLMATEQVQSFMPAFSYSSNGSVRDATASEGPSPDGYGGSSPALPVVPARVFSSPASSSQPPWAHLGSLARNAACIAAASLLTAVPVGAAAARECLQEPGLQTPDTPALVLASALAPTEAPREARAGGAARFTDPAFAEVYTGNLIKKGEKSERVRVIQQAFLDLGFAVPGGADGVAGTNFETAVKNFQAGQKGLDRDGVLGGATLDRLKAVAPAPGKKAWQDPALPRDAYVQPRKIGDRYARMIISTSQHRLFLYRQNGSLEHIYPVASGADGSPTHTGTKIVADRVDDPSGIAWKLWPESGGKAFGTRLFDLEWYDPATGAVTNSGEELHGTYVRDSLGKNASHGCMRMYNEDVEALYGVVRRGDRVLVVS